RGGPSASRAPRSRLRTSKLSSWPPICRDGARTSEGGCPYDGDRGGVTPRSPAHDAHAASQDGVVHLVVSARTSPCSRTMPYEPHTDPLRSGGVEAAQRREATDEDRGRER